MLKILPKLEGCSCIKVLIKSSMPASKKPCNVLILSLTQGVLLYFLDCPCITRQENSRWNLIYLMRFTFAVWGSNSPIWILYWCLGKTNSSFNINQSCLELTTHATDYNITVITYPANQKRPRQLDKAIQRSFLILVRSLIFNPYIIFWYLMTTANMKNLLPGRAFRTI